MTKADLNILEKAYAAEIDTALSKRQHYFQSKSKRVERLVDEGYLSKVAIRDGLLTVVHFELTHLGRMSYCMSEICQADMQGDAS